MKKYTFENLIQKIKKIIFLKKLKFNKSENIIRLGSNYGGWGFYDDKNLYNSTIISAGLGEDASFDVDFLNKYDSKMIIIDPTPRATAHYKKILNIKNHQKTKNYSNTGVQEIESYDLSKINSENFILIEKALFNKDDLTLNFYKPKNPDHVSHSISNFLNDHSIETDHIKVKTITLKTIMDKFKVSKLVLLKMDIEGAEIQVIENMLENKIYPDQICVEFDELSKINKKSVENFFKIHKQLIDANYILTKANKFPNMLYLLKND